MRILVVEDSVRLADTLAEALMKENYIVDVAHDGRQGYEYAISGIYDIMILDLMLPKMNGYEVLSAIRREGQEVPVLILSAKNELEDKVQGFMVGADDYVTKPFEIQELLMRIQAICRRRGTLEIVTLRAGNLSLDSTTCEICNCDSGKTMKIAGKEMQLLEFLLLNQNQVLEKEQIATKIWGYESDAEYNNVEVYVSFLRRKFKYLNVTVRIRAVRGVGYILEGSND
ncbi:MAG: response regulator transcription factor [Lachnospiraceae bacterium]|nr:response regulator transcription factor [Agathobacter sp.]MDD6291670.1 response regulator transcription factor [Lachnospiraceae bacterium]